MSATPQLPPVAKLEQKTVVDLIAKGIESTSADTTVQADHNNNRCN